ncbi:MAG: hypothetical protein WCQ21_30560 [Verrucomicrobiota bacterium]|jgi:hypothetical protein
MADGTHWDGLQFFNPDLDRKASYALTFQDRVSLNCSRTGAQLMEEGITISGMTGDRASEIIWIEGPASRSP